MSSSTTHQTEDLHTRFEILVLSDFGTSESSTNKRTQKNEGINTIYFLRLKTLERASTTTQAHADSHHSLHPAQVELLSYSILGRNFFSSYPMNCLPLNSSPEFRSSLPAATAEKSSPTAATFIASPLISSKKRNLSEIDPPLDSTVVDNKKHKMDSSLDVSINMNESKAEETEADDWTVVPSEQKELRNPETNEEAQLAAQVLQMAASFSRDSSTTSGSASASWGVSSGSILTVSTTASLTTTRDMLASSSSSSFCPAVMRPPQIPIIDLTAEDVDDIPQTEMAMMMACTKNSASPPTEATSSTTAASVQSKTLQEDIVTDPTAMELEDISKAETTTPFTCAKDSSMPSATVAATPTTAVELEECTTEEPTPVDTAIEKVNDDDNDDNKNCNSSNSEDLLACSTTDTTVVVHDNSEVEGSAVMHNDDNNITLDLDAQACDIITECVATPVTIGQRYCSGCMQQQQQQCDQKGRKVAMVASVWCQDCACCYCDSCHQRIHTQNSNNDNDMMTVPIDDQGRPFCQHHVETIVHEAGQPFLTILFNMVLLIGTSYWVGRQVLEYLQSLHGSALADYFLESSCPLVQQVRRHELVLMYVQHDFYFYQTVLQDQLGNMCKIEDTVWKFVLDVWVRGILTSTDSWTLLLVKAPTLLGCMGVLCLTVPTLLALPYSILATILRRMDLYCVPAGGFCIKSILAKVHRLVVALFTIPLLGCCSSKASSNVLAPKTLDPSLNQAPIPYNRTSILPRLSRGMANDFGYFFQRAKRVIARVIVAVFLWVFLIRVTLLCTSVSSPIQEQQSRPLQQPLWKYLTLPDSTATATTTVVGATYLSSLGDMTWIPNSISSVPMDTLAWIQDISQELMAEFLLYLPGSGIDHSSDDDSYALVTLPYTTTTTTSSPSFTYYLPDDTVTMNHYQDLEPQEQLDEESQGGGLTILLMLVRVVLLVLIGSRIVPELIRQMKMTLAR